jgi:putative Mn2+ efflux pump MntP
VGFPSILLLAVGLALDAVAAAAARGCAAGILGPREVLKVALLFGGFQGLMPWAGATLGTAAGAWVEPLDHWIAFLLLAGIGVQMLRSAAHAAPAEERSSRPFAWGTLLPLALATSIDAFAAGITLPLVHAPLWLAVGTIAGVTAVLSAVGLYCGCQFGNLLGGKLEVLGGVLLIGLGGKVLIEHLAAG